MDNNLENIAQAEYKRPQLKTGSVLSLISHILYLLYSLGLGYLVYIIVALTHAFAGAAEGGVTAETSITLALVIIPFIVRIALSIAGIVLSAKTLKICKLSPEQYQKKKKIANALMIFNVILLCVGVYSISGLELGDAEIMSIIIFAIEIIIYILFVIATALLVIAIGKENKKNQGNNKVVVSKDKDGNVIETKASEYFAQKQTDCKPCETTDGVIVPAHTDHEVKDSSTIDKTEELARIDNLKKQGLISDDEYKAMIKKLDEQ